MTVDQGMFTCLHTLQDGVIRGVGNVNDHPKVIHFPDDLSSEIVNSSPATDIIAGINKSIGGIMCGKLDGSKA